MMKAYTIAMTALIIAVAQINAYAADTTWLGTTDNNWQDASNWDNGVPLNSDYQSKAHFGAGATATTITNMGYQSVWGLIFTTAGWTLDGDIDGFKVLESSGIGTNKITGKLNQLKQGGATFTIGEGNRFVVGSYLRNYDKDCTITGGGTLEVGNFSGATWSPSRNINLTNITVRVRNSIPHSGGNDKTVMNLLGDDVTLELLTSNVSAVEALFGNSIFDPDGAGVRLAATYNSTTTYTEVIVVPTLPLGAVVIIN